MGTTATAQPSAPASAAGDPEIGRSVRGTRPGVRHCGFHHLRTVEEDHLDGPRAYVDPAAESHESSSSVWILTASLSRSESE